MNTNWRDTLPCIVLSALQVNTHTIFYMQEHVLSMSTSIMRRNLPSWSSEQVPLLPCSQHEEKHLFSHTALWHLMPFKSSPLLAQQRAHKPLSVSNR